MCEDEREDCEYSYIFFAKDPDSNIVGLWFDERPIWNEERQEFNVADVYVDDDDALNVINSIRPNEKKIEEGYIYTIRCDYLGKDKERRKN